MAASTSRALGERSEEAASSSALLLLAEASDGGEVALLGSIIVVSLSPVLGSGSRVGIASSEEHLEKELGSMGKRSALSMQCSDEWRRQRLVVCVW